MKGTMRILKKAASRAGAAVSIAVNRLDAGCVTVLLVTVDGCAWTGSGSTQDEAAAAVLVAVLENRERENQNSDPMADAGLL